MTSLPMTSLPTTTPDNDALWRDPDGRPTFRHKPKLVGSQISFSLTDKDLAWSDGRVSGRLPLHQIESVRIAFRPANIYTRRYRVEVRQRLGRRVWFSNVSWRGMVDIEAHDAPFAAFTRLLLTRIAKSSPQARFLAGEPAWRYWAVATVSAGLALSLAYLAVSAIRVLNWTVLGFVVLLGGYTIWQMSLWLDKNRPGTFDPLDPPGRLLPERLTPPPAARP